jgi:hypothetical protein
MSVAVNSSVYISDRVLLMYDVHPLTPNDLYRRGAVSTLKIKTPSQNTHEKPTNTPIIQSVY